MEKALKALERIKNAPTIYVGLASDIYTRYSFECKEIENALKALEIIKREPSAVIEIITTYDNWEEYINDYPLSDKTIWHIIKSKEEYELVKGVLL